jgi:hypothetical protein
MDAIIAATARMLPSGSLNLFGGLEPRTLRMIEVLP